MKTIIQVSQILKYPSCYQLRIEEAPFDIIQRHSKVNGAKIQGDRLVLYSGKLTEWNVGDLNKFVMENKIPLSTKVSIRINGGSCYDSNKIVKNTEVEKYINMIASGEHIEKRVK